MNARATSVGLGGEPPRATGTSTRNTKLGPTRLAGAIGLGLADRLFVGLTQGAVSIPGTAWLLLLIGAITATIATNRARRRGTAWTLLAASYVLVVLGAVEYAPPAYNLLSGQIMAHCLVLCIFIADQVVASSQSPRLVYFVAALVGIATGALIWTIIVSNAPALVAEVQWHPMPTSRSFAILHAIYVALHWLLFGGAAVVFYAERRLAHIALERLRAAELDRITRSREVVESRLQAMQARVEPTFLFDTLGHVAGLYQRDAWLAERMLEALVAFLRAAMPHMRHTSSTVVQEAELVRAYLGVARIRLDGRLEFSIDVGNVAHARLPAMMLLPLVNDVLRRSRSTSDERTLEVRASAVGERLHVTITDTGFIVDTGASEISAIRERLRVLYGADGRIAVNDDTGGRVTHMEIPYEPTARTSESMEPDATASWTKPSVL